MSLSSIAAYFRKKKVLIVLVVSSKQRNVDLSLRDEQAISPRVRENCDREACMNRFVLDAWYSNTSPLQIQRFDEDEG
jgi:hypothetical protein